MAVLRTPTELHHPVNYVASIALFAGVSCLILMLKFGGFKANINFYARNKKKESDDESLAGAYRINRDEFFDSGRLSKAQNNVPISTFQFPSEIQSNPALRPTKSTSDLTRRNKLPAQLHKSVNDVSHDPRGAPPVNANRNTRTDERVLKKDNKEQIKLEKKRLAAQKANEKIAAKEQEKQEKLRKKREKEAAREQEKLQKKKRQAPQPKTTTPLANTTSTVTNTISNSASTTSNTASRDQTVNLLANQVSRNTPTQPSSSVVQLRNQEPYSTNTLQSSISRSSGPPPYSEVTTTVESKSSGSNVTFSKPIPETNNSWDLISQHRQQMSKPTTGQPLMKGPKKNMVMDLQYKLGNDNNSDA